MKKPAALLLCVFLRPVLTLACSCATLPLSDRIWVEQAFRSASVVFEGVLIPLEPRFTLRVLRVYKGPDRQIFIVNKTALTNCDYTFRPGITYLVYASGSKAAGIEDLYTSICGRTGPLKDRASDLRFLRGEPPAPEDLLTPEEKEALAKGLTPNNTGILCGRISRVGGAPLGRAWVYAWMVGNRKPVKFVSSEPDGVYQIKLLPPGDYFLTSIDHGDVELESFSEQPPAIGIYGGGRRFEEATPIVVKAREKHCGLDFTIEQPTGFELRVNVRTEDGTEIAALQAGLRTPEGEPFEISRISEDDHSPFRFFGVPAGPYLVRVFSTKPLGWGGRAEVNLFGDQELTMVVRREKK